MPRLAAGANNAANCAPSRISLRLLGGFELRVAGALVSVPSATQRLLALLALRGRTERRPLAGCLWPSTANNRALASLRTNIWRANQGVPGLVVATRGVVALVGDADVDVHRLVMKSRVMLDAAFGNPELFDLGFDDGELLPGWDDPWLVADRERLWQLRLHVLEVMAEQLATEGHYGAALEFAIAAVRADELRESAHRALIRIHLAEGNVVEAMRAYQRCTRLLAEELGVRPSQATDALVPPRWSQRAANTYGSAARKGDS